MGGVSTRSPAGMVPPRSKEAGIKERTILSRVESYTSGAMLCANNSALFLGAADGTTLLLSFVLKDRVIVPSLSQNAFLYATKDTSLFLLPGERARSCSPTADRERMYLCASLFVRRRSLDSHFFFPALCRSLVRSTVPWSGTPAGRVCVAGDGSPTDVRYTSQNYGVLSLHGSRIKQRESNSQHPLIEL